MEQEYCQGQVCVDIALSLMSEYINKLLLHFGNGTNSFWFLRKVVHVQYAFTITNHTCTKDLMPSFEKEF